MAVFNLMIAGRVGTVHSLFESTKDYCGRYLTAEPGEFTVEVTKAHLLTQQEAPDAVTLSPGETVRFGDYEITCVPAAEIVNTDTVFTVCTSGPITVRSRQSGDDLRLSGGSKSVKKRFIDKKIPASKRAGIPVLCDEGGILAVAELGAQADRRASELPAVTIRIVNTSES